MQVRILSPVRTKGEAVKKPCGCPGPLCGDQDYETMFNEMRGRYLTGDQSEHNLRAIHLKWKKIASRL